MKPPSMYFGNFDAAVSHFFAPPLPLQPKGQMSTLHLARREVQQCFFREVIAEDAIAADQRQRHALFATAMVIMAAVDLMAKLFKGAASTRGSGARARQFMQRFFFDDGPESAEFAKVVYQGCRNPLMHAFSLKNSEAFTVALTCHSVGRAVQKHPASVKYDVDYLINVEGLYTSFRKSVRDYERALREDRSLEAPFRRMHPEYGLIFFQDEGAE